MATVEAGGRYHHNCECNVHGIRTDGSFCECQTGQTARELATRRGVIRKARSSPAPVVDQG
jgi:hypothetical protein